MSKHLVIVESPAKAKTIKRFLGKDFIVEASMGHVRDLPSSSLAVDIAAGFVPEYEVPEEKASVVKKLKEAYKETGDLWIATDEDREGEAIGWHLTQVLKIQKPESIRRIVFHEITETAIKAAIENPRTLDMRLVDAQQARRVLDRLVGYTLSPFLWKKVYRGLSAGRVQSVAVRIIVDREREVRAFVPVEYWTVAADLETGIHENFEALLSKKDGQKFVPGSATEADDVVCSLKGASFRVQSIEEKELKRTPPPPFTTSTLQQEAARKLGFSVKQTMVVAQQLYEGVSLGKGEGMMGLITYMRTDSVNLSDKALQDSVRVIGQHFGREYVLAEPRRFKTKAKGAQEAHEAIRPTELERIPQSLANVLDHQQLKLYTLIWNRTIASQMPLAELRRIGADIEAKNYTFRATGQTVIFDGFLRVYEEGRDEPDERKVEDDEATLGTKILPPLATGDPLSLQRIMPEQHFTKPPPRYTEASLVKKLEEEGIGRPSTYAPTISTIQQRGYVRKEGKQLVPEDVALVVTDLFIEHFPDVVDPGFTASMEQKLDEVAEGKHIGADFLRSFFGPFEKRVMEKNEEIQKSDILKERVIGVDPVSGLEVIARIGRFGPFLQLGRMDPVDPNAKKKKKTKAPKEKKAKLRSASIPKKFFIDSITLPDALALLSFPKELGLHEGVPVTVFLGRFGPYLKCGETTVTLKDIDHQAVTLSEAVRLMAEAAERKKRAAEPLRALGKDPATGAEMLLKDGRYGPYITDGKTNASLGKKLSPDTITAEQAVELLAKKRTRGPSRWRSRG